jgi:two-component system NtrC family sensor kinase
MARIMVCHSRLKALGAQLSRQFVDSFKTSFMPLRNQSLKVVIVKKAPIPNNEQERMVEVQQLTDFGKELSELDWVVKLAAQICQTPIALVSIVSADKQNFAAKIGLHVNSTGRDISFCGHAVCDGKMLIVSDASKDARFADNPLVASAPNIRFYAGAPLTTKRGFNLGTLCVIDSKVHHMSDEQRWALETLSIKVVEIFEEKKAKEKYKLLVQRYEYILEGAGLGSWDWWLDSNQVTFDARWCEMIGLKREETAMELATWDSRVHPDDKACAYEAIKNYLAGKTPYYENIHRLKHSQGHWVWILDRGRISEYDQQGKAIRFTGTHFDISQQKKLEEKIEFERQKNFQQAKLASLGQLAAGVGHEINNPLAIMKSDMYLMEHHLETNVYSVDELKVLCKQMDKNLDRIAAIVKSMRSFTSKDNKTIEPFNLAEMMKEIGEMISAMMKGECIEIQYNFQVSPDYMFFGHKSRIEQVLINLLTNARDALEAVENPVIKMGIQRRGDRLFLEISDNGIGINSELQHKIFDPFFTTKDPNKGTGLGLSIVNSIIEEHKGRIELKSGHGGQGATFIIELPVIKWVAAA